MQINPGGTRRGHGTIADANVFNDGIVRPGGSIGTLTIQGSYVQSPAGTLMIDVSPTAASQLKVAAGSATLAGTLSLLYGPGTYTTKRSEEHTSELQSLMRISYAVFCLK